MKLKNRDKKSFMCKLQNSIDPGLITYLMYELADFSLQCLALKKKPGAFTIGVC